MTMENDENGAVETDAAVLLENGEPVAAVIQLPTDDDEIIEENGDVSDAVAIAAIEADRDTTIAEIHADVETARIEAEQERERSWQDEAAELQANMMELKSAVETLTENLSAVQAAQSTPAPSTEVLAETAVIVEPTDLTPLSTSDETSETLTELSPESVEENPEAPVAPVRRRRRLI